MTNAPEAAPGRPRRTERTGVVIVVAAMMLFSMFFGAGNLIFPPILGASSGESFVPAVLGFLILG
ncbi:hypothetical protein SA15R_06145, partial [Rothia kristinae]|uniref:branched-chain amino acid transport system II carrier protein n=1 Tax=Rothia kristinae TaxID=37923 RepID=UPI00079C2F2A